MADEIRRDQREDEGRGDPRRRNRGPAARRKPKQTSRAAVVGLFVIVAALLFALGLFMIGDRRSLFARDFEVYTEFERVGGIQKGAIVRVAGANGGEVEEIRVPRNPSEKFRVKLRVLEDMHGLVRTDSVASIQTDGLVGNKFIQIEAGTAAAPEVPNGATIAGADLFDFTQLLHQASDTLDEVTSLVAEVRESINDALGSITDTTADANRILEGLDRELTDILQKGSVVVTDMGTIVTAIRDGKGTAGKLVNDPELYDRANALLDESRKVVAKVDEAADQVKALTADMGSKDGPVHGAIADLRHTLAGTREVVADLSENSEALKRNLFFRGFFARRGYYDLDDIPVEDYRAGALEAGDRRVVRVWLSADVLFAPDPDGTGEQLTDAGKARLESAMSDFLTLPPDSPLVVEGYAEAPTYDARYIGSRQRAERVRDYLVARTRIDVSRMGVMAMGNKAPGSPSGDTWDGIAIAIFVRTKDDGPLP